jgi:hypothetical protein
MADIQITRTIKDEIWCFCPFHEESRPSFSVNEDTGYWYCFGCNRGGTLKYLISLLNQSRSGNKLPMPDQIAPVDFWKYVEKEVVRSYLNVMSAKLSILAKEARQAWSEDIDAEGYTFWQEFDIYCDRFDEIAATYEYGVRRKYKINFAPLLRYLKRLHSFGNYWQSRIEWRIKQLQNN